MAEGSPMVLRWWKGLESAFWGLLVFFRYEAYCRSGNVQDSCMLWIFIISSCSWTRSCGTTAKAQVLQTMILYCCMCWKMPSKSSRMLPIFSVDLCCGGENDSNRCCYNFDVTNSPLYTYPPCCNHSYSLYLLEKPFVDCLCASRQFIHDASVLRWASPTLPRRSPADDFIWRPPKKIISIVLATFLVIRCIAVLPTLISKFYDLRCSNKPPSKIQKNHRLDKPDPPQISLELSIKPRWFLRRIIVRIIVSSSNNVFRLLYLLISIFDIEVVLIRKYYSIEIR